MEFEVGGFQYRSERLNAQQCYDVARRFSVVLIMLGGMKGSDAQPDRQSFARALCAVSRPVPQEDSDTAIGICLSAVSRRQPNDVGWQKIREPRSGRLIFEDIDMMSMLEIVWEVMDYHKLPDFFSVTPATLGALTQG